jgi:serine phosphatase RsbU (regulator of sigma subunit)
MPDQKVSDRFLTAALATLCPISDGVTKRYASAGHPPALIGRERHCGRADRERVLLSLLLGLNPSHWRRRPSPRSARRHLAVTDGITEARGRATWGPLFGEDRPVNAVDATPGADAADTLAQPRQRAAKH